MAMKPKRYSVWLALQNLKAVVKFSGMTRLGLVWRRIVFGVYHEKKRSTLMKQIKSQTAEIKP
jgi:hypothetical protein